MPILPAGCKCGEGRSTAGSALTVSLGWKGVPKPRQIWMLTLQMRGTQLRSTCCLQGSSDAEGKKGARTPCACPLWVWSREGNLTGARGEQHTSRKNRDPGPLPCFLLHLSRNLSSPPRGCDKLGGPPSFGASVSSKIKEKRGVSGHAILYAPALDFARHTSSLRLSGINTRINEKVRSGPGCCWRTAKQGVRC